MSLELRVFERYLSTPKQSALVAINATGNIDITSASIIYDLTRSRPLVGAEVGVAYVTAPFLTVSGSGAFAVEGVGGIGPLVGVSLRYPVGSVLMGVDVRAVHARLGLPPRTYISVTGADAMGVTYNQTTALTSTTVIVAAFSLRALIF